MSNNILVTGGAGYLGSILVPELLAQGHRVTVLDNFMFRQSSINHVCSNPNFKIVKGDIVFMKKNRVHKITASGNSRAVRMAVSRSDVAHVYQDDM